MGLNNNTKSKHINAITGNQDDHSALTTRTGDSNISSNVTQDKLHRRNLVTSYPSRKHPIHIRERTEPHGSKAYDKG